MKHAVASTLLTLGLLVSCKNGSTPENPVKTEITASGNAAMVPLSWIGKRVEKARTTLEKSEAGKVIWNAMEAHGGLATWYKNGALAFRFNYQPVEGTARDSYQIIDTWSNKAKHTSVGDSTAHFGWTGKTAWIQAVDSTTFAYDTKFWALTPYYFLGQPFVLDGTGVHLELMPQVIYKDTNHHVVKVTFAAGTGDAPDDYYILYISVESNQLKVIRYIVSYPEYFKEGGHAPEKFMEVIGETTVDGILFPTDYKTYWLTDDQQPGEYITKIEVSDISFKKDLPKNYFNVPINAHIID